jgi:Rhodopirellula transposase DDE domain
LESTPGQFAVNSVRLWLDRIGRARYLGMSRLMITADGGGSNGSRLRLWKWSLQQLADETGLTIQVCHYPPGTSKWNKIEHRMFCFITQNWRAMPLVSLYVAIALIAHTTTKKRAFNQLRTRSQHLSQRHKGLRRRNGQPQHNS